MIVILSGDGDVSTDYVVEALVQLEHKFFRVNSFDLLNNRVYLSLKKDGRVIILGGQEIDLDTVGAVWYRKFGFFYKSNQYRELSAVFDVEIANNISKEFSSILEAIVFTLYDKNWLTHPKTIGINKFDVIKQAQKFEIDTPDSYIINDKDCLMELLLKDELITKSIRDPWIIRKGIKSIRKSYSMFTSILNRDEVNQISATFFPSLVQSKIDKDFKIRSFYLAGKFYSMAIFSQLDKQTVSVPKNPTA